MVSKVVAQNPVQLLRALIKGNLFSLGGGAVNVSCFSMSTTTAE